MSKNLVIVESPTKARTVGRFLGSTYEAMASMGHVRDLPKGKLGVKVEDLSFEPEYRLVRDRGKLIKDLGKAAREAENVYLATDPDREGEAISWHLMEAAKIDPAKAKRVVFHEITAAAVREAFDNPRELDRRLIDAQQARRVLDRLVGYELSPVLWKKVKRGLSAGRVQSVAVRMVVEREAERDAFVKREYWVIRAELARPGDDQASFKARLRGIQGKKGALEVGDGDTAARIVAELRSAAYTVDSVTTKEKRQRPSPPFITSTLQQEASRKLRYSAAMTMSVAQQLYEGVTLGTKGSVGLITYMRTDSTSVAASALAETAEVIRQRFGERYAPSSPRLYRRKVRGAQEAHEAIRPTSVSNTPESVRPHLTAEQNRLYRLIWNRMVASQMPDAVFDQTTVDVAADAGAGTVYSLRAGASVMKFSGHRELYLEGRDDEKAEDGQGPARGAAGDADAPARSLPTLADGDALSCRGVEPEQRFTEPPPQYTDATLIRALEEQGIGRPSTYAPTLGVIQTRDYVRKDGGRFAPTKLGVAVNGLLTRHFPETVDIGFTARVEEELDDIASGDRDWVPVLREFYGPFHDTVERADREAERVPRSEIDEESDEVCEKCERSMVIKTGRFGRFLSCSGFPDCRNSRALRVGTCPECSGDLVERRRKGKGGKRFFGCAEYPECDFATSRPPLKERCPECSGMLVAAGRDRARCLACKFSGPVPEPAGAMAEAPA